MRSGFCGEGDLELQAANGEKLLSDAQGDYVADRVIMPTNASPYVRKRAAADIIARRQALRNIAPPTE